MADHADIAGDTVEVCQADAERRARGRSDPTKQKDWALWDGIHCVEPDCEIELPEARAALCRIRCVDCQVLLEKGLI